MDKDVYQNAEAELAAIEQKLADLAPLQQRREQLRAWIALTRQVYPDVVSPVAVATLPTSHDSAPVSAQAQITKPVFAPGTMRPRRESMKDRVAAVAAEIILAEGPMLSRQLVERLKTRGVEVGGADPAIGVSTILSRNDNFKSDRAAGGWVLAQPHKEVTPPSAPTLAGS